MSLFDSGVVKSPITFNASLDVFPTFDLIPKVKYLFLTGCRYGEAYAAEGGKMIRDRKRKRPLRVVMLGPSLKTSGGIAAMVNVWLSYGLEKRIKLRYIQTLKHNLPGRNFSKGMQAFGAMGKLFLAMMFGRPDVVHFHVSFYNSFHRKRLLSHLPRWFRVPYVALLVSGGFETFLQKHPGNIPLARQFFDRAASVIVLSESWKNVMEKYTSNPRLRVIYNTTSLKEFEKACAVEHPEAVVVLFFSRLSRTKGLSDLLEAVPEVAAKCPNVLFRVCGYGNAEKARKRVSERGCDAHVEILGWIPGEQKYGHFLGAHVYVLPSYFEGMPGSVLDAMASHLPVVATKVGGIPEQVIDGETGYLIEPGDVSSLSDRLVRLCSDEKLRNQMGEAAFRRFNERFSPDRVLDRLMGIYREVAGLSSPASSPP